MRDVLLAVLAGGEGSRMGRPKGELRVGDVPILEYLLERWKWDGPTMLVTAPGREHPPGWERFDREVRDAASGEGPLRGIVTALQHCGEAQRLVVATCDMPGVTREMFARLLEALEESLGVMMRRADAIEPFPMALRAGALELLVGRLARGERSLQSVATLPEFKCVNGPDDAGVWTNLNNPSDYEAFQRRPR